MPQFPSYTALTAPKPNTAFVVLDPNDSSMSPQGTTKEMTLAAMGNNIKTKTANYTITTSDYVVFGDTTSSGFTFTLPDATTCPGQPFVIQNLVGNNALVIAPVLSQTIDGSASSLSDPTGYTGITLVSDGANWHTFGSSGYFNQAVVNVALSVLTLKLFGGLRTENIATKTSNYTVTTSDYILLGDSSLGNVTFTLPDATTCFGQRFIFKITNATNAVFFATVAGQTIDGASPSFWALGSTQNSGFGIVSNGANWDVVSTFGLDSALTVLGLSAFQAGIQTQSVTTKNSNYTLTTSDYIILSDGTSNTVALTLPDASFIKGQTYLIKCVNATHTTTLTPHAGQTINGFSSYSLLHTGWVAHIVSDGVSNWNVLGAFGFTDNNSLDDSAGNAVFTGNVQIDGGVNLNSSSYVSNTQGIGFIPGTSSIAPITMSAGTNLTTPVAGSIEYDGVAVYGTGDTTSGRGIIPVEQQFRLTATGGTISTIANYFGTTSNISLVSGAEYEIEIIAWFLKTTAGTVTWTFTNSAAPTSMTLDYQMSPATGIVTTPGTTDLFGQQYNITATAPTVVSPSLTTAVNHRHRFWIRLINGTGTSLKIQATCSAGTITPGINSYWKAQRVPLANVGHFAA